MGDGDDGGRRVMELPHDWCDLSDPGFAWCSRCGAIRSAARPYVYRRPGSSEPASSTLPRCFSASHPCVRDGDIQSYVRGPASRFLSVRATAVGAELTLRATFGGDSIELYPDQIVRLKWLLGGQEGE